MLLTAIWRSTAVRIMAAIILTLVMIAAVTRPVSAQTTLTPLTKAQQDSFSIVRQTRLLVAATTLKHELDRAPGLHVYHVLTAPNCTRATRVLVLVERATLPLAFVRHDTVYYAPARSTIARGDTVTLAAVCVSPWQVATPVTP